MATSLKILANLSSLRKGYLGWSILILLSIISGTPKPANAEMVKAASNTETVTATPPANIQRPVLKLGSQGNEVSELQAALKLLGYYNGNVTGLYSEKTAIAVSQFQESAGLIADGIVGPVTWNRLFPASLNNSTEAMPISSQTTINNKHIKEKW